MTRIGNRLLTAIASAALLLLAEPFARAAEKPAEPTSTVASASLGASESVAKSEPKIGHIHTTATPTIRVKGKVDDARRMPLYGHVPMALRHAVDLGRIDP